jgi:hypothetical protein
MEESKESVQTRVQATAASQDIQEEKESES